MATAGFNIAISAVDKASGALDKINKRLAALGAPAQRFNRQVARLGETTGVARLTERMQSLSARSLDTFRSLDRIVPALGAITGAASIAGMTALVNRWAQLGQQTQIAGQKLGVPTDRLTALRGAARLAGASAEDLNSGLASLYERLHSATFRQDGDAIQAFNALGVNFGKIGVKAREADEAFGDVAEGVKRLYDSGEVGRGAALRITQKLGLESLFPLLIQGRKGVQALSAEAAKLGVVISPEAAEKAAELERSFTKVALAAEGLGNKIAETLSPVLTPLLGNLSDWIADNNTLAASRIGDWVKGFADDAKDLGANLSSVVNAVNGIPKPLLYGLIGGRLGGIPGFLAGAAFGAKEEIGRPIAGTDPTTGIPPWQQPAPDQQFTWWNPGTWWHHESAIQPNRLGFLPSRRDESSASQDAKAARVRDALAHDLNLTKDQAAGIVSNLEAESGLKGVNEINPAPGTRGGFGWAQWTGPRRDLFERWAAARHLDPSSDEANYNFLLADLQTRYAGVLADVRRQPDAGSAARSFFSYESGGDPDLDRNLPSHIRDAQHVAALPSPGSVAAPASPLAPTGTAAAASGQAQDGASGASGHVQVDITLRGAPAGTVVKATTSGPVTAPAPRVETAMPGY